MNIGLTPLEICKRLVAVGRYSGEEKDTADVVSHVMDELGYEEISVMPCGTVVGLFGPADSPVCTLFDGHIDVATVAGEWDFAPFCAEEKDGLLLGRGTSDMKGGLSAALWAVAQYAHTHILTQRIAVSASVMEETIEGLGMEEVLERYQPACVVICEPSEGAVMIGQKGRMEILLTLNGKAAHASTPEEGINSLLMAAHALLALGQMSPPQSDLLGTGILVPTDIITTPYPSISSLPEKTTIRFDRRTLPGETEEGVLGAIGDVLEQAGITEFSLHIAKDKFTTYTERQYERSVSLLPWSLPQDTCLFRAMAAATYDVLDREPTVSAWKCCTNGSESAGRCNIPTIGMGPGSIVQAHTVNEFIHIDEIDRVSRIYERFLHRWCQ